MGNTLREHEEVDLLVYALASIANESNDVESVRISMTALYETTVGRAHFAANPVKL